MKMENKLPFMMIFLLYIYYIIINIYKLFIDLTVFCCSCSTQVSKSDEDFHKHKDDELVCFAIFMVIQKQNKITTSKIKSTIIGYFIKLRLCHAVF